MICSLSGEFTNNAVVSPKSGAIFDRALIEKYIAASGTDPISDEPLLVDELIGLHAGNGNSSFVAPKPPTFNSIPSMLGAFQAEWDALALEVFSLRKQLQKTREELSSALYHHDAAVRVAARAVRERDEAKEALESITKNIAINAVPAATNGAANGSANGASGEIPVDLIADARARLFLLHKAQKPVLALPQDSALRVVAKSVAHPFEKAAAAELSHDLLVGSLEGSVAVISSSDYSVSKYKSSSTSGAVAVLSTVLDSETPIVCYENGDVFVGADESKFAHGHASIFKILTHPLLRHLFVLLGAESWSLNDASSKTQLFHSQKPESGAKAISADIHVDGMLLAVGYDNGSIAIYDLTSGNVTATINVRHSSVQQVVFAPNGYWLLVASSQTDTHAVEVIDLRKSSVLHCFEGSVAITDVTIDPSSSLVAVLSNKKLVLHRYLKKGKKWINNVHELETEALTGLYMVSEAELPAFQQGIVTFLGVGEDSNVFEFQVSAP